MTKNYKTFTRAERIGLIFAAPWIIGFLVFGLYPLLASAYFSFSRYNIVRPPLFIGLEQRRQVWHKKNCVAPYGANDIEVCLF